MRLSLLLLVLVLSVAVVSARPRIEEADEDNMVEKTWGWIEDMKAKMRDLWRKMKDQFRRQDSNSQMNVEKESDEDLLF